MNTQILSEITALKRKILPNDKLILFGSQARGDERLDSDWDLLLLLNKEKINFNNDYDKYGFPLSEIGDKYGTYISVKIYSQNDWIRYRTPFRYNVEHDGIEIK